MSTDDHHPPATPHDPHHPEDHPRHEHRQPTGAESPHNLLAVHDPSRRRATPRQTTTRAGGVTVQWLRPTELATRVASHTAARAVTAHAAAHRQARAELRTALSRTRDQISSSMRSRGRLAPPSAFGQHATPDALTTEHSGPSR
jgi:hypothetical protein